MKILFISDIHGSSYYLDKVLELLPELKVDKIVILGDILYHGPRNPLPKGYDCQKVLKALNLLKDKIIAVRGNCDSEVDQMVLDFPIQKDYETLDVDNHHFFITHGHLFNEENLPPLLNQGDILIYGHFHKPIAKKVGGIYILNPSSISLPKEGTNSFGIYENHEFKIYDLNLNILKTIKLT